MKSHKNRSLGPLLFLLYIDDLLLASEFSTTLFAVDKYLQLSDHNLHSLQCGVNTELQKVDGWQKLIKVSKDKIF